MELILGSESNEKKRKRRGEKNYGDGIRCLPFRRKG